jgi:hypothetical protein
MNETFRRKLHGHEKNALIDALAILTSIPEAKKHLEPNTIDTMRTMIGLKGVMDESMNKAIAEGVENEKPKRFYGFIIKKEQGDYRLCQVDNKMAVSYGTWSVMKKQGTGWFKEQEDLTEDQARMEFGHLTRNVA